MTFPHPPIAPMEATSIARLPEGAGWQYEPKWDGFRCLAFRVGSDIFLESKAQRPLARYFPEVVAAIRKLRAKRFVLDGELVVPVHGLLDFDQLLQRIHPAESRIRKLSSAIPAWFIVFDLLATARGSIMDRPLGERRRMLEEFAGKHFPANGLIRLSPAVTSLAKANKWLAAVGGNLDGIIAKRTDSLYHPGERDVVFKVKRIRSADCVVGGFRYGVRGKQVGSLLLGLYDDDGLLHHVGFTATIRDVDRPALTRKLEKLIHPPGFTGQAPGGPSRWSTKRSTEWQPLAPKLVVEVTYDQMSGHRFRHGTALLRWRPDKAPRQCTFEQVRRHGAELRLLRFAKSA